MARQDKLDRQSMEMERTEVADREAAVAALSQRMATTLSMIHGHLLRYNLHSDFFHKPNGRALWGELDELVDLLDDIKHR